MTVPKFADLDKNDFTESEFQLLIDSISLLADWDKKYNPQKYELINRAILEPTNISIPPKIV